jgi:2Fe-2S ferredoxin
MPKVTYIQPDRSSRDLDVKVGTSLMQAAISGNVKGIEAECGGCCSCATCHVYVDPAMVDRVPPPDPGEVELLAGVAAERRPNSRLSCQIMATPDLDGLVVEIPDRQT